MDGNALIAASGVGTLAAVALRSPELLKEVYGDLAKPGVSQVGQALGTVLELSSNLLLPLRLLNETCRQFEKAKFDAIAERFKSIPEDKVISVSPEIGAPILNSLSYTQDNTIRRMFIELLAKACDKESVDLAHPAFSNIISNISPDEAHLIKHFSSIHSIPYMFVWQKVSEDGAYRILSDTVLNCPKSVQFEKNIPMYISNLEGMGILQIQNDKFLTDKSAYDKIYQRISTIYPSVVEGDLIEFDDKKPVSSIIASRGVVEIRPFGRSFIKACLPD